MLKKLFFYLIFVISSFTSKAQDTTIYMNPIEVVDSSLKFDINKLNQYDENGKKHAYWKEYHPNKKMRYEGQFNHGIQFGLFNHYYDNGVMKGSFNYFNDGQNASAHLYHPNGKRMAQGNYKNQKKDSLWIYYHISGYQIAEEFYHMGEKHGTAKVFFEDGAILEESNWKNGKQDGVWKENYYQSRKPKFIINYKDGLRDGETQFFYESGSIKGSGFYKKSHRDGSWTYYKEDGSLLRKVAYKEGKVIQTFEPESVKNSREQEDKMMGDKKIESIEDLDDQLKPFIQKY
jgi:antitoxin component YwqK of YwqJK toxin-antitoxin module